MHKQFAVLGLGRFGSSLARTLTQMGHEVLGIDRNEENIEDLAQEITQSVQGNAEEIAVLNTLGVRNMDVAIVAMGDNIQSSIMITMLCKELGVPYVVARANDDLHAKVLTRVGANRVVFPERDMGIRTAHSLVSNNILEFIEFSDDYTMLEIIAPAHWDHKTLQDLHISKYGVNVIAIKSQGEVHVAPSGKDRLYTGDILVVLGDTKGLRKLEMLME